MFGSGECHGYTSTVCICGKGKQDSNLLSEVKYGWSVLMGFHYYWFHPRHLSSSVLVLVMIQYVMGIPMVSESVLILIFGFPAMKMQLPCRLHALTIGRTNRK